MRSVALILFSIAVSGVAGAQNEPAAGDGGDARNQERPEEIVVRGRRLADLRIEVQIARERAYDIFNEINSDDDFDIGCSVEQRTGTRLGRQVCAARFEGRISSRAAKDYLATMRLLCPSDTGLTQDCLFDPGLAGRGAAAAQAVEGEALNKRDQLNREIQRLAREDLRFGQRPSSISTTRACGTTRSASGRENKGASARRTQGQSRLLASMRG